MNEDVYKKAHPRIPKEFWEALLTIHNNLFAPTLSAYWNELGTPRRRELQPVMDAFNTLSCWLDIAIEEGWLE